MKNSIKILIVLYMAITLGACSDYESNENMSQSFDLLKDVPPKVWERLGEKRIIFGHHSVGREILQGVDEILAQNQNAKLNIVELEDKIEKNEGYLGHFCVGKNRDPKSKNRSFYNILHSNRSSQADIAFFKYCYVDFNEDSDVHDIFNDYKQTMNKLNGNFPNTTIMHTTVPLRTTDRKYNWNLWNDGLKKTKYWKNKLRRLFNYSVVYQEKENIKRNEFNELLKKEYEGKQPILDIAKIESTYPDGRQNLTKYRDKEFLSLIPEYSRDGGHLNEFGRKLLGEAMLLTLINLSESEN